MGNAWKLFRSDLKRLFANVVTGIIVLGLVALPSIFSWYNILACWDAFDNTGNLKVAVANSDEGYESDLVAIRVNIGERLVSALRANDQLDWVITDEEDAVDGAMSGKYYAAVVIPKTFSADMMTFYSDDAQRADIVYYANEKRSAIAPKITDQGADRVAYQVNKSFTETLTRISLSVIESLSDYLDGTDAQEKVATMASHLQLAGKQIGQAASTVRSYTQVVSSSKSLVSSSANLLQQTKAAADEAVAKASRSKQAFQDIGEAFDTTVTALDAAIEKTSSYYESLPGAIGSTFDSADKLAADSAASLRAQAALADDNISALRRVASKLEALEKLVLESGKARIRAAKGLLDNGVTLLESSKAKLVQAADDIESSSSESKRNRDEAANLAAQAKKNMEDLRNSYNSNIKPQMNSLRNDLGKLASSLQSSADELDESTASIMDSAASVNGELDATTAKLNGIADKLDTSSRNVQQLGDDIAEALSRNDMDSVKQLIEANPDALAAALAAPVALDRTAVFPAENFGSQMAPLYTMLAMWIGSLLLSVAIRVVVPEEDEAKLNNPKHHQIFLGHFGVFALISFMQTTCTAVGNLLFLGVQAAHPLLYLLCFWVSGLVFAFIIYALVAAFANLGKAVAVLMLIVQVTGCNGAFPLQLLPPFIQSLSAWLPGTHTINAMRAAMFGIYQNDYWISMGLLLLFVVPAAIIGLVLSKPLSRFMSWYIKRVESSKLMA